MLVTGKMTRKMDKGHIPQKTKLTMTANGNWERNMVKPRLFIPTDQNTKACLSMTRNQARVHTPHTTRGNILENGKPARKTVKAGRLMQTAR